MRMSSSTIGALSVPTLLRHYNYDIATMYTYCRSPSSFNTNQWYVCVACKDQEACVDARSCRQ